MFGYGKNEKEWENAKLREQNLELIAKFGNLKRFVDKLDERVRELERLVEEEPEEEERT